MERRLLWLLAGPAALLLTGATARPLTQPQKHELAALLTCPENLPDDAARHQAMIRYNSTYARFSPGSTINERLSFRERVLEAKQCQDDQLIYTFPQD